MTSTTKLPNQSLHVYIHEFQGFKKFIRTINLSDFYAKYHGYIIFVFFETSCCTLYFVVIVSRFM